MIMDKDNLSSLYSALISKGYSVDDLGDENTFRSKMSDKGNRKELYDYVSGRGDFRIGDYDSYEDRLSSSFARPSRGNIPAEGAVARQVVDEYDKSVADGGGVDNAFDPTARMLQLIGETKDVPAKRPSLKEMVSKEKETRDQGKRPSLPEEPGYSGNARSEQRDYAPVRLETMQYNPAVEEDKEVDRIYTPEAVTDERDIIHNYRNRFGLTKRGMELGDELGDIQEGIVSKYMEEFRKTPEYLSLAGKKTSTKEEADALNRQVNELFQRQYGERIYNDMMPYEEAYQQELFDRYGYRINDELRALGKKDTKEQVAELASGVDKLLDEKHSELKLRSGSGNNAFNALMGSMAYNRATGKQRRDIGALESARRLLEESQEIIKEAGRKGNTSFVGGLARGAADNFDPEKWAFGLADMADSAYFLNALNKADKGEALTEPEEKLLEASVINMATQAYFSSDLGRGYKAGRVTAESLPFMLEFIANPISSSGSAIAKSLLKFGTKRFGGAAVNKGVSKFAARLLGDSAAAAGMLATTGIPRVVSGTLERLGNNYDYKLDDEGNLKVNKVGGVGAGEALARSLGSTYFENQSEMVFNAFKLWNPFMKAAEKALPGGVNEFMQRMINSKPARLYKELRDDPVFKEIARRAQFHGLPEEYMEEVYNNFANVAMGEMSAEEAFDLDNNIDTFLGLAPTSVAFGLIGLGGMAAERVSNRRKMRQLLETFNDGQKAKFEELKTLSRKDGNKDIREFIKQTMADGSLTPEQKRDEIEYAYELAKSNAIDDMSNEQDPDGKAADDAYVEGAESAPEEHYSFGKGYDLAERSLQDKNPVLFETVRGMLDEGATIAQLRNALGPSVNGEEWNLISDYYNQKIRLDGAVDAAEAEVQEDVDRFSSNLDPAVVTSEDGVQSVTSAMYKDIPVYVVAYNGANAVIIQDGRKKMVPSKELSDVRTSAKDDIVNSYREQLLASRQSRLENSISHHPKTRFPQPGMTVWNGDTEMVVSSVEDDGTVHAFPAGFDNKTGQMVPKQGSNEVVMSSDEAMELQDIYYDRLSGETSSLDTGTPGAMKVLSDGRTAVRTGISNDGQEVSFDIMDRNGNVVDSDAMPVSDYMSLADVPESGTASAGIGQDIGNMSEKEVENDTRSLEQDDKMSKPVTENVVAPEPVSETSGVIPVDERGNPLYHKVPVDTTLADLLDGTLDDGEVDGFIEANRQEAESGLKKVSAKAPKIGTNKARYIAERNIWQEKVNEAQVRVDYWNQVKDAVKESRIQPGDKTADEIRAMGHPMDGHELAAQMLASGQLPLLREDYMRETGFGKAEASGLFGLFRSKDSGGMTVEEAGEKLMLADMEDGTGFFDRNDANAGRNAILDVLSSVRKRGDLLNYIKSNREAMAERERIAEQEYEEAQREAWAQENFGMSYSDYLVFEEVIDDIIQEKMLPEDVIQEFYDNFANELNNWNNGRTTEEAPVDERGPVSGGSEVSEGILPSEPIGNNRGAEANAASEIGKRADNEGIPAQEGKSGIIPEIEDARQEVDTDPTEAQKKAGNYKKGHIKLEGYDITIENPKGSERSGTDADGNKWSVVMNNDYGYIRGTEGVDGDHIDVFLSDKPEQGNVFVVDQVNEDGSFDEHKVMYGFNSAEEARAAYLANYSPGWKGLGTITEVSKDEFNKWVDSSTRKTKPFAEYKSVNPISSPENSGETIENLPESSVIAENEKRDGGIRFREVEESDGTKSLVGLHNISEDKLRKALRMGGLANPSAAVIDISKQTHEGYGEISLILPSAMIDKRTGRNAGTWSQDAWTPVYPQVEKQFGKEGNKNATNDILSVPKEMQGTIRNGINSWMDGRSGKDLAYLYLHEQGKAPKLVRVEPKYSQSLHNDVKNIIGNEIFYNLDEKQRIELLNLYIRENFSGDKSAYEKSLQGKMQRIEEKIKLRNNPKSLLVKRAQEDLIYLKEKGYDYRELDDFVEDVLNDANYAGTVNDAGTLLKAQEYIAENGLQKDFDEWLDNLNERYEVKEVIFDGFTPSGKRRYVPNTLENVSKLMKREGRNAATGISVSFNTFAASILKAHGSLKDIRKEKEKLTADHSEVDAFRDKWSDIFYNLGLKLQPGAVGYETYGLARLMEAAQSKNPKKYLKDEYNIDFADEDVARLKEMIDAIRTEYPATYFETKFERPVYLNEFAAAVVPDNTSSDIISNLKDSGLKVFTYKDGDGQSRSAAVKEASKTEGIRFRFIGKQGAANLDKAEEATTRLDNLSVARDMEREFNAKKERIAKLRESKPVEITGNEHEGKYELNRDSAQKYILDNLRGEYTINDTGEKVKVSKKGSKKVTSHSQGNEAHMKSIAAIPELIENAVFIEERPAYKENAQYDSYRYYVTGLKIGEENYTVRITIGVKNGKFYYDHYLTEIEKGNLIEVAQSFKPTEDAPNPSYAENKDSILLSILQTNAKENARKIKMATGWERGADGKWRYEVDDFDVDVEGLARRNSLTPEQRRVTLAEETEDVAREDQIFLNDAFGIPQDKLLYVDKEKALDSSAVEQGKITQAIEDLSSSLHTPIKIARTPDDVTDESAKRAIGQGRMIKAWFDPGTGEVAVYMPNATDVNDAVRSVLHEVVAHKGLRDLLVRKGIEGAEERRKAFDDSMMELYNQLPADVKKEIADIAARSYGGEISIAMDEYLAEQAEKDVTPSWWGRVVSAVRDLLRRIGINVELSGNDVKYLLWRSRKNLERGNVFSQAEDIVMRNKLGLGEYSKTPEKKENTRFREGNSGKIDPESTIRGLNARIRSLEKTVEKYEDTEELRRGVTDFIRKEIRRDLVGYFNKEDLNSLLVQAQSAKTKKSLERIVMNVKTVVLNARRRKLQRMVDKLLSLKVQDVNGKNMSIAKNVDDSTRRIFSFMKGRISDLKLSGFEEDMTYLRRDSRGKREEISRLERSLSEAKDKEERSRIEGRIAELRAGIDENRSRISELEKESGLIKEQVANAGDIDIDAEIARLNSKMDEAAMGKAAWTLGDSERMAALNIIQGVITGRKYDSQVEDIEIEKQKIVLENSQRYKDRVGEPDFNKRRRINEQINENRRRLVALDRLISDARSMQVKQLEMAVEELNELVSNGKNSLLRRVEEEAARKRDLIGGAIRSVKGKPIDVFDDKAKKENTLKKFFSAPMGSFEYMCKRVNTQTLGKDGFLYKRFVEGPEGVMKAYDTYVSGMKELKERLDAKANEIFGKGFSKIASLSDNIIEGSGVYVFQSREGEGYGVKYQMPLSKGQAMYIYQVWKMADGRTKLELQGFDEESVAQIVDFIGPEYVKFADWVQEDFLKGLREKYNEKYLAMYNTSMADIENYIPLKIRKEGIRQETSLSDDGKKRKTLEEKAGSLINRTFNTNRVDITCSGFDVLWEHGNQMEEWNAYARVRKDLDYILSSTTFRLQLNANVRGSYENFYDAAEVATKTYHPDMAKYGDEILGKWSKGIVGGNIAFRMSTALKQVLSAPAFLGYSQNPKFVYGLLKNSGNLWGSFKWGMENIPSFYERVSSGTVGNEKLDEKGFSKLMDKYIEFGMIPNKMIDAITCAIGARSIYDYRYALLKKSGVAEEEARNQALVEADIYYNATQQSSHPAFLSPMQMSRTFTDRMLTTYQNSNIGYVRRVLSAFYDLTRSVKWKELKQNYIDMYMQEGLPEQEAERKAYRRLLNENRKNITEILLFGWGLNLLWELGSQGLSMLSKGDDDDNMWTNGMSFLLTSPVKGLPGGNLLESVASGYGMNPFLVYDELEKFIRESKYAVDEYGLISPEIAYMTLSKASRYAGVDLEVWGNVYMGAEGMMRDGGFVDDGLINTMYMLNFPKSNRAGVARWLYKDEPMEVFAEKVARASKYIRRDDSLESKVPGAKELTKRKEREFEKQYERLHMTDEEKLLEDEMKIASKVKRKLKELGDDEAAIESYIENNQEAYEIYEKYY